MGDWIGRVPVMMISILLTSLFTFAGSFVNGALWAWWLLRFLAGLTSKGLFMSALLIAVESVGPRWKMTLGIAIHVLLPCPPSS